MSTLRVRRCWRAFAVGVSQDISLDHLLDDDRNTPSHRFLRSTFTTSTTEEINIHHFNEQRDQGRHKVIVCSQNRHAMIHPSSPKFSTCSLENERIYTGWWSGVVVSALASINEVNQRRARLVLRWMTVFNSRCRTFISVCNQPATQGQLSLPSLRGR